MPLCNSVSTVLEETGGMEIGVNMNINEKYNVINDYDNNDVIKLRLIKEFEKVYGDSAGASVFFAPGRVNLIGEHTDYNGGCVFPCAITLGTYIVIRKSESSMTRYYSMNFEHMGVIEGRISNIKYFKSSGWANYPKSIVWALQKKNVIIGSGFDMLVYGNLPNGSGLSSSASLEAVTLYALIKLYNIRMDKIEMAKLCQFAENEFIGMNCGIMDQFAIIMGRKDNVIYLDTGKLKYKYVPVRLKDVRIVIASSNKKRKLGESKYNERRSECERAYSFLKEEAAKDGLEVSSLCELDMEQFEKYSYVLKDDILYRRAKHAISENERTKRAVKAFIHDDVEQFGHLMNESHISLRDDYEVTGYELDTLVNAAWECDGVIGSRMTGAGFGGCTVSIVREDCISSFIKNVGEKYNAKTHLNADFYVVDLSDGVCAL